jgi:ABC-type multidrug transport system fused ATPase/permease subunit
MEEKPRSATMHAMYYGLITGAAMVIFSLILYIADLYMNSTIGYISFLILIGGMIWGTLDFRKLSPNGLLTYGKAFSTCFLIALFAAIISALYTFVFAEFINPNFSQEILDKAREGMMNSGQPMTDEQIDQAMTWTERFTTPVMITIWGFITTVAISAIISLVAAIFLKKEDKSLNATM